LLQQMSVSQTMDPQVPSVPGDMWLVDLADRIARHDPEVSRHQALVVTDSKDNLAGIITRADIFRALEKASSQSMTVLEAGTRNLIVTYPDESLHEASAKMLRNNIGRLPVVDRGNPGHVIGYLGRQEIMAARLRRLDEEHVREPGWIKGSWG
jgi:CIC family chloride channel protein